METATIRTELPKIIDRYKIETMLDIPCGDYHWMSQISLNLQEYIGADIVSNLIKKNREYFENNMIKFRSLDLLLDKLPQVDLVFCRDCMVHFTDHQIWEAIANIKMSGSKYLMCTTFPLQSNNKLEFFHTWRAINLEAPPFNLSKPLLIVHENSKYAEKYADKSMGLWALDSIELAIV